MPEHEISLKRTLFFVFFSFFFHFSMILNNQSRYISNQSHRKISSDRKSRFTISTHIIKTSKLNFTLKTFLNGKICKSFTNNHCVLHQTKHFGPLCWLPFKPEVNKQLLCILYRNISYHKTWSIYDVLQVLRGHP